MKKAILVAHVAADLHRALKLRLTAEGKTISKFMADAATAYLKPVKSLKKARPSEK